LQATFIEVAQRIVVFGADSATVAQMEELRGGIAVVERDLALTPNP
jgi:hypothetical protein